MTTFNEKLIPSAVSVVAFRDTESLLLVSGRERRLLVRDEIDALIDSHLEVPRGLRFIDTSCEESSESLGNSDNTCEKEFNMNIRESEEEVVVDLFENNNQDGEFTPSFTMYNTTEEAFARKVLYATCQDRALLAFNHGIMCSTQRKLEEMKEEGVAADSFEYQEVLRKNKDATASFEFLCDHFDPLSKCIAYHLVDIVPEYLHMEVSKEIDRLLVEEPEILYKDQTQKVLLKDTMSEGSGKYRAAMNRELEFNSGDDLFHVGQGMMPESQNEFPDNFGMIPYLLVQDEPVTYMSPILKNGQWTEVEKKALSIFVTKGTPYRVTILQDGEQVEVTRHNFVTVPLVRVYHKYYQIREQLVSFAQKENWLQFNLLKNQHDLGMKPIKQLSQTLKDLRDIMYMVSMEASSTDNFGWRSHRKPSAALPKAMYRIKEMEILGKNCLVSVFVV